MNNWNLSERNISSSYGYIKTKRKSWNEFALVEMIVVLILTLSTTIMTSIALSSGLFSEGKWTFTSFLLIKGLNIYESEIVTIISLISAYFVIVFVEDLVVKKYGADYDIWFANPLFFTILILWILPDFFNDLMLGLNAGLF